MVGSIGPTSSVNAASAVAPASSDVVRRTASDAPNGATLAALSQSVFTSSLYPGPLGLSRPLNPEDAAAILAEAELALDQTASQSRDSRIANTFAAARMALGAFDGVIGAARSTIAQDQADAAADAKRGGDVAQRQGELGLQRDLAGQASAVASVVAAGLNAAAPLYPAKVGRDAYVSQLSASRTALSQEVSDIAGKVAQAQQGALKDRTAALEAEIADVDAKIAVNGDAGNANALAELHATRDALAGDLAALPATLAQSYGAVFAAATAPLQRSIDALQSSIDAANRDKKATYGASDYAAAARGVSAAASDLAGQVGSLTTALSAAADEAAAIAGDIDKLAADMSAQQQSVSRGAAALIPVFSRIATDTVGGGAAAQDRAKSSGLAKGFEDLEAAVRKLRDDEMAQRVDGARQRDQNAASVDADRVAGLAAALSAGLDELRSAVKQETASAPGRVPDGAAFAVGQRYRLSL